jgi:membrane-bound serine protease (ClpP class)
MPTKWSLSTLAVVLTAMASMAPDAGTDGGVAPYTPLPDHPATSGPPSPGEPGDREVPGPLSGGGIGKHVAVVDVHGNIDLGLAPFIVDTLGSTAGLSLVVLDIDTPGGRVDAALMIRDALLNAEVPTVAFVHPRAISAGALIAYGCETIAMVPGGSIGAATPITINPIKAPLGGGASPVDEKMVSYLRTEFATTARARDRRGDIAEAMVDSDVHIEGVTPAGKLLTLDTDNALELGVADLRVESLEDLLAKMHLDGAEIQRPEPGWAFELARILTHPVLTGILMMLGMAGILLELRSPGFGAPGIVGIACLLIFFFGHTVVHLSGWEEILLFGIGVGLLAVEIFVTPGFGILGALGIVAIVGSLVLALSGLPLDVSLSVGQLRTAFLRVAASAALAGALFALIMALLPRTRLVRPLVLATELASGPSHVAGRSPRLEGSVTVGKGDTGRAVTILRPAGKARFGGITLVVESDGAFIDRGRPVVVVTMLGDRVLVREIDEAG